MEKYWRQAITESITCIDTGFVRPMFCACYLIESQGKAAFIDTGTTHSLPRAIAALQEKNLTPDDVAYVIPTHVHLDHAGGVGAMMQAFPNAQLVIHPRGARHMINPSKLIEGVKAVYGEDVFNRDYGELPPVDEARVIEAPDNHRIDFNGRELLFIDTPGHARHHFCVFDQTSGSLFTGDTLGISYRELDSPQGHYIFATTTPVQFDPDAWQATLDTLMALQPRRFLITHFGEIPASAELVQRLRSSINNFAEIAKQAPKDNRHAHISEQLQNLLLNELNQHACELPESELLQILDGDIELNSQGLDFWQSQLEQRQHTT